MLVLVASFFVPGGPTGAGWTLYPPQAILSGTPGGQGAWDNPYACIVGPFHRRLYNGWTKLCGHSAAEDELGG